MLTIVIPIYLSDPLHMEFTQETLNSIKAKYNYRVVIIVNHAAPQFKPFLNSLNATYNILHTTKNSLSQAWNLGIKQGLKNKSDYILIANNDIVFHPQAIDNLVAFATAHPEFLLWTSTEHDNLRTLSLARWDGSFDIHPHFSCFMINPKTVATIGYFDENLDTAYFEDNDYHIRILLAGQQAAATTTARFYHYGSRTSTVDDDLRLKLKPFYEKNRHYIKAKWGLDLHGRYFSPPEKILDEIYSHPFNNPLMTIKDW